MRSFSEEMARADALLQQGQAGLAVDILRRLSGTPLSPRAVFEVNAAMASASASLGDMPQLVEAYRRACASGGALPEEHRAAYSNYLFALHYLPGVNDARLFAEHIAFMRLFPDVRQYEHGAENHRHKKIRLAYLSPDFGMQTNTFFVVQLLACHDRERFEVYCYNARPHGGAVEEQLRSFADVWRDVPDWQAADIAARIYEDEIDIFIDLSGHAAGGHTLVTAAYRPAPVQVTAIGWFDTTGLPAVDYVLADRWAVPPGSEKFFLEKPLRLQNHSFLCYTPPSSVQYVTQQRKRHESIVFGSFNNFCKITEPQMGLWREILCRTPGSRLILKNTGERMAEERRLRRIAARIGFSEGEVEFRSGTSDYLAQYLDIDIALDTYPYPGGGTTCDALFMGVPVISLYGERFGSRFGLSLLSALGLPELAAATVDEYVEKAAALAASPETLDALHEGLRERMKASPLMDGLGYTREVESLYEKAWQEWIQ